MKVRLAAQLLSNSVADALQYCKEKGIPGFEKSVYIACCQSDNGLKSDNGL